MLRVLAPLPPLLKALPRDGLGVARLLTDGLALGLGRLTEGDAAGLLIDGDALGRVAGVAPVLGRAAPGVMPVLGRAAPAPVPVVGRVPMEGVPVLGRALGALPEPQPRASCVRALCIVEGDPEERRRF